MCVCVLWLDVGANGLRISTRLDISTPVYNISIMHTGKSRSCWANFEFRL